MMDGQQRADAKLPHIFQLRAVMRDRRLVDFAARRHDARPFHAHTGDGQMQPRHQRAVFTPAVPVVVGHRGVRVVLDPALMVPVIPVASDLAALDLRRGGTDAKQKSFRELQPHGSSSFYLLWVYILVYIVCVFPVSRKCQFWTKAGLKICSGFHIAKLR